MTILLKRFQLTANGLTPDGEQSFDGSTLTIGASGDRNIIIEWPGVQLRHAEITLNGDTLEVTSQAKDKISKPGFLFGSRKVKKATIKSGKSFSVGNHEFAFSVVEGQATLTITVDEKTARPSDPLYRTRLAQNGISKRRWSMWGLAIIALAFVALPVAKIAIQKDNGASVVADYLSPEINEYLPEQIKQLQPLEYNHLLPSDSSWNTGEFHPAHQFFANDCSTCHNEAFTPVTKQTCMSCHGSVSHHFPPNASALYASEETNCQTCHKEHNGEDKLVTDNQNLCIDCHQEITQFTSGNTKLQDVKDWKSTHPEITLNMASWDQESQAWMHQQENATNPPAEQSGVIFPHDLHLRASGFDIGEDQPKVLACADCHVPERGGALMLPVQMEPHCESCHQLEIDVNNSPRDVQHGSIDALLVEIAGLKGLSALLPQPDPSDVKAKQEVKVDKLKLPGKTDKSSLLAKQSLTLAGIAKGLIEQRACITCHNVSSDIQAIEDGQLYDAWEIAPVHIVQRWIDDAEFDHSKHLSMSCNACHGEISQSASAEDVNIPSRGLCQSCHGNPDDDHLTPSQCIDCHSYHITGHGLLETPDSDILLPAEMQ